jgi:hypothetical protein
MEGAPERCGTSLETIQRECGGLSVEAARTETVGHCTCREVQKNPNGAPERCGTSLDTLQRECSAPTSPFTGRCSCRDALAGNNPICGTTTPQLRSFCENPTSMPLANANEDGRIGRRVK